MKILITGGSGFIGSYLVDLFNTEKHEIFVIDNLLEQVHGRDKHNSYLYRSIKDKVSFYEEDILGSNALNTLIGKVDIIIHLAAETGTGQSMYNISNCVKTNSSGTAHILEQIVKNKNGLRKFILASSRAVYGEGKYKCKEHGIIYPLNRDMSDLLKGEFECKCPECNKDLIPLATDEESKISPKSVYGITKFNQEQLVRSVCESIKIPYSIFRFQNVYGKGQSVNNPYTGILSIFTKLVLDNKRIIVFEDGLESRDFIHAADVSRAIYADVLSNHNNQTYNVGSGTRIKVIEIINMIREISSFSPVYEISGSFRLGDIRHNFADTTRIGFLLGFHTEISLNDGLSGLIDWISNSHDGLNINSYESSINEMKKLNLYIENKN